MSHINPSEFQDSIFCYSIWFAIYVLGYLLCYSFLWYLQCENFKYAWRLYNFIATNVIVHSNTSFELKQSNGTCSNLVKNVMEGFPNATGAASGEKLHEDRIACHFCWYAWYPLQTLVYMLQFMFVSYGTSLVFRSSQWKVIKKHYNMFIPPGILFIYCASMFYQFTGFQDWLLHYHGYRDQIVILTQFGFVTSVGLIIFMVLLLSHMSKYNLAEMPHFDRMMNKWVVHNAVGAYATWFYIGALDGLTIIVAVAFKGSNLQIYISSIFAILMTAVSCLLWHIFDVFVLNRVNRECSRYLIGPHLTAFLFTLCSCFGCQILYSNVRPVPILTLLIMTTIFALFKIRLTFNPPRLQDFIILDLDAAQENSVISDSEIYVEVPGTFENEEEMLEPIEEVTHSKEAFWKFPLLSDFIKVFKIFLRKNEK